MTDQQILIDAIEKAGFVIADHIDPWRTSDPEQTISRLARVARAGTTDPNKKPAGMNRRAFIRSHYLGNPQIFRRRFAPVFHLFETHLGTFIEVA
jgi:hypothetical protein